MTWDDRDVRLNWRDETFSALVAEDPAPDAVDDVIAGWAASGLAFADYLAQFDALGVTR